MRARSVAGAINVDGILERGRDARLHLVPGHLGAVVQRRLRVRNLCSLRQIQRAGEVVSGRREGVDLQLGQGVRGEVAQKLVL